MAEINMMSFHYYKKKRKHSLAFGMPKNVSAILCNSEILQYQQIIHIMSFGCGHEWPL